MRMHSPAFGWLCFQMALLPNGAAAEQACFSMTLLDIDPMMTVLNLLQTMPFFPNCSPARVAAYVILPLQLHMI